MRRERQCAHAHVQHGVGPAARGKRSSDRNAPVGAKARRISADAEVEVPEVPKKWGKRSSDRNAPVGAKTRRLRADADVQVAEVLQRGGNRTAIATREEAAPVGAKARRLRADADVEVAEVLQRAPLLLRQLGAAELRADGRRERGGVRRQNVPHRRGALLGVQVRGVNPRVERL